MLRCAIVTPPIQQNVKLKKAKHKKKKKNTFYVHSFETQRHFTTLQKQAENFYQRVIGCFQKTTKTFIFSESHCLYRSHEDNLKENDSSRG